MAEIKEIPFFKHRRPEVWKAIVMVLNMISKGFNIIELEEVVNICIDTIVSVVKKET